MLNLPRIFYSIIAGITSLSAFNVACALNFPDVPIFLDCRDDNAEVIKEYTYSVKPDLKNAKQVKRSVEFDWLAVPKFSKNIITSEKSGYSADKLKNLTPKDIDILNRIIISIEANCVGLGGVTKTSEFRKAGDKLECAEGEGIKVEILMPECFIGEEFGLYGDVKGHLTLKQTTDDEVQYQANVTVSKNNKLELSTPTTSSISLIEVPKVTVEGPKASKLLFSTSSKIGK